MQGKTRKKLIVVLLVIGTGLCISGIFAPISIAGGLIAVGGTCIGGALAVIKMLFNNNVSTPDQSQEQPVQPNLRLDIPISPIAPRHAPEINGIVTPPPPLRRNSPPPAPRHQDQVRNPRPRTF